MPHEEQHPNWRDWRLVIMLGLPLGLLELGLFAFTMALPTWLSPLNALLLAWLMYFLSAGMIEYLFCSRRRRGDWDPSGAGFIVALVGCACFMLSVTVLMIFALIVNDNTPHPYNPRLYSSSAFDRSVALIALLFLAFLNVVALAFSAAGARFGRALVMRRAKRCQAHEQRAN